MKIRQDQLDDTLKRGLANVYLVSGDDPLLVQEACAKIRFAARKQGFDEREVFHAEANFNWTSLREEANALSLFASKRILEVRIPTGKPSDKGETLKALIENPNPDNLLLLICPRLDASTQKTAWVKAVEKAGVLLPIWPLDSAQFPLWLKHRLQQLGLSMDHDALMLFAQQYEGNLLAAAQEIEKLRLLDEPHISLELLQAATTQQARFDVFQLVESAMYGSLIETVRMLQTLRAEGTEILPMLGLVVRNLRQLIQLKQKPVNAETFTSMGIWPKQQGAYQHALKNLSLAQLHACLRKAEEVDNAAKGNGEDAWRLISELLAMMTGKLIT